MIIYFVIFRLRFLYFDFDFYISTLIFTFRLRFLHFDFDILNIVFLSVMGKHTYSGLHALKFDRVIRCHFLD